MYLIPNITKEDLKEVLLKYNFFEEHKNAYFTRKNNIGNLIYDHFFQLLYNRFFKIEVDEVSQEDYDNGIKDFIKSIESCNSDYKYFIDDNKVNFSFTRRKYLITNFYNILLYEIYVNKIFKELTCALYKKWYQNYLFEEKYFWYFRIFDFDIQNESEISISWYKHYFDWWSKFESVRDALLQDNQFYIETDIEGFYDNISHDSLIHNLSEFFRIYGDNNSDDFIYKFSWILFKVAWYTKKWIPQWVMASDILSTLYLWLHFFLKRDWNGLKLNPAWFFELSDGVKFISYNDDFYFFWKNDSIKLSWIFNWTIRTSLENEGMKLNSEKTKDVKESVLFDNFNQINIELIQQRNKEEIKKLGEFIVNQLNLDLANIHLKALRKYFKWIKNIRYLDEVESSKFFDEIWLFFSSDINQDKVKKIFILLIISTEDFLYIIRGLIGKKWEEAIDIFLKRNYFKNNMHLLSESLILKLYLWIDSEWDISLSELSTFFSEYLNGKNNKFIVSYLNNSQKPLDIIIQDNGLLWLHKVLYGNQGIFNYSEDILGIKLYSLFWIATSNQRLVEFLRQENQDAIRKLTFVVNGILDDMIITKNIFPDYFLKNPSFLSDLYSLFNILLTFHIHILRSDILEVKIWWGAEAWFITINWKTDLKSLRTYDNDFDVETIHLMYYIAKKRAIYNHKEVSTIDRDIWSYIYKKYDDLTTFHNSISKWITSLLNIISKELI